MGTRVPLHTAAPGSHLLQLPDVGKARQRLDRIERIVAADVVANHEQLERVAPLFEDRERIGINVLVDTIEGDDHLLGVRRVVFLEADHAVCLQICHLQIESIRTDPPMRWSIRRNLVIQQDHFLYTSNWCVYSR